MIKKEKIIKRRRSAAIIDTPKGILVCAKKGWDFMIPGGGARWYETRKMATLEKSKKSWD
ncbi:MAG: hypothetical protein QW273_02700 [Candidatus Pacearchaeota archaeon]